MNDPYFCRTKTVEEIYSPNKRTPNKEASGTKERDSVSNMPYKEGQIFAETMIKMLKIERRNSILKARRNSVNFTNLNKSALAEIVGRDKIRRENGDEEQHKSDQNERSGDQGTPKKLPPILRSQYSFNEFEHKLSRQTSQQSDKSGGSQTSLLAGIIKRKMSMGDSSMFKVKSHIRKGDGVVSQVTGDLSVKLTKAKPMGFPRPGPSQGNFDLQQFISNIPRCEEGTTRIRPLSSDVRLCKPGLRRVKSSVPAMVFYSIKPDISRLLKRAPGRQNSNEPRPARSGFQRAVMAVKASNIISLQKVWRV